jgi:hypothetical protein
MSGRRWSSEADGARNLHARSDASLPTVSRRLPARSRLFQGVSLPHRGVSSPQPPWLPGRYDSPMRLIVFGAVVLVVVPWGLLRLQDP